VATDDRLLDEVESYDDVPLVPRDAEVDPHFAELMAQRTTLVPSAYLPTAVSGEQPLWRRWAAGVLIGLLVTATAGGVCLTYGPDELFALLTR
jgi:hypothetical protein